MKKRLRTILHSRVLRLISWTCFWLFAVNVMAEITGLYPWQPYVDPNVASKLTLVWHDFRDVDGPVLRCEAHLLPNIIRAVAQNSAPVDTKIVISRTQRNRHLSAAESLRQSARGAVWFQVCHLRRASDPQVGRLQGSLVSQNELETLCVFQAECGPGRLIHRAPEPKPSFVDAPYARDHIVLQNEFVLGYPTMPIARRGSRKTDSPLRPSTNR